MPYLTQSNAQKIADSIMEIVPYNINIMDQKGEIIASGDKGRIGSIHQGAVKVIEGRGMHNVYDLIVTKNVL